VRGGTGGLEDGRRRTPVEFTGKVVLVTGPGRL
jgi:hypothetical protein